MPLPPEALDLTSLKKNVAALNFAGLAAMSWRGSRHSIKENDFDISLLLENLRRVWAGKPYHKKRRGAYGLSKSQSGKDLSILPALLDSQYELGSLQINE